MFATPEKSTLTCLTRLARRNQQAGRWMIAALWVIAALLLWLILRR